MSQTTTVTVTAEFIQKLIHTVREVERMNNTFAQRGGQLEESIIDDFLSQLKYLKPRVGEILVILGTLNDPGINNVLGYLEADHRRLTTLLEKLKASKRN